MADPVNNPPVTKKDPGFLSGISKISDWAVRYGVSGYDRETRRRLSICNIAGYLSAASSLSFVINFLMYDFMAMKWLILGNLLSAFLTITAPFWHRFNSLASPIVLATTVAITLFFFISELGRDSGIQLNYIGSVAIAFAIFGLGHLRWVLFVTFVCIIGHLSSYFLFETGRVQYAVDEAFLNQIYILSAVSIMIVLALIVWYAYSLAADAEARSEALLLNVLPVSIAERLRREPDLIIADKFDEASVMFADIIGFTNMTRAMSAEALVNMLNTIFSEFDQAADTEEVEKIKTIGDAYMAVCGVPEPNDDHAQKVMKFALHIQKNLKEISASQGIQLQMRIGIATGPITAGVIGKSRFAYDVWSNTVNLASRLEANGEPGIIRVCHASYLALRDQYEFEKWPVETLKGIGRTRSWLLVQ
ncbi:MAG: adenylate/guanylate cyclase domain-containing protein [Rhizobiaceae bacterium]